MKFLARLDRPTSLSVAGVVAARLAPSNGSAGPPVERFRGTARETPRFPNLGPARTADRDRRQGGRPDIPAAIGSLGTAAAALCPFTIGRDLHRYLERGHDRPDRVPVVRRDNSGPTLVVPTRRPGAVGGLALASSIASGSWPVRRAFEPIAEHSPARPPLPPAACSARSGCYMACGPLEARGHSATRIVWPKWSGADRLRRSPRPRRRGRWCSCSVRR